MTSQPCAATLRAVATAARESADELKRCGYQDRALRDFAIVLDREAERASTLTPSPSSGASELVKEGRKIAGLLKFSRFAAYAEPIDRMAARIQELEGLLGEARATVELTAVSHQNVVAEKESAERRLSEVEKERDAYKGVVEAARKLISGGEIERIGSEAINASAPLHLYVALKRAVLALPRHSGDAK
jgi:chromosome segregation ATPase